jgi:hypothetical protein
MDNDNDNDNDGSQWQMANGKWAWGWSGSKRMHNYTIFNLYGRGAKIMYQLPCSPAFASGVHMQWRQRAACVWSVFCVALCSVLYVLC